MTPQEIDVHIEELVLHGFAAGTRWNVADGLENELRELLVTRGIPPAWQPSPERIDAGAMHVDLAARPAALGAEIARAVHQGGAR